MTGPCITSSEDLSKYNDEELERLRKGIVRIANENRGNKYIEADAHADIETIEKELRRRREKERRR
jgi:hypothetical protein